MKGITSMLASAAVAAMRYSSTSWLKLQYQIAYTEKGTGWRIWLNELIGKNQ